MPTSQSKNEPQDSPINPPSHFHHRRRREYRTDGYSQSHDETSDLQIEVFSNAIKSALILFFTCRIGNCATAAVRKVIRRRREEDGITYAERYERYQRQEDRILVHLEGASVSHDGVGFDRRIWDLHGWW